jgi:hypothetical protein
MNNEMSGEYASYANDAKLTAIKNLEHFLEHGYNEAARRKTKELIEHYRGMNEDFGNEIEALSPYIDNAKTDEAIKGLRKLKEKYDKH